MSHPCVKKTQGGTDFSRNRLFVAKGCTLEAGWSDNPTFKELNWSWKFHQDPFIQSKVIQLFNPDRETNRQTDRQTDIQKDRHTDIQTDRQTHTQTDRQTDRHTFLSIHRWVKSFMPFLIPFTSLHLFCSLCSWRISCRKLSHSFHYQLSLTSPLYSLD